MSWYGRDAVESYPALVARAVKATGLLEESAPFEIKEPIRLYRPARFPRHWEVTENTVSVELHSRDALSRSLLVSWVSEGEPHEECICVVKQPCHLGGSRWWLLCPVSLWLRDRFTGREGWQGCERPQYALYFRQGRFGCRSCQRLTYRTCQRGLRARAFEKGLGY